MSIGILERAAVSPTRDGMNQQSGDWESPAGPVESGVQARAQPPSLTYHGLGDEHWRGQTCHAIAGRDDTIGERIVIMACGCQASVPSWTLEPIVPPDPP